jgi:hypothetical protein
MAEGGAYPAPSWLAPARKKDLATLREIARRSRDFYARVTTQDDACFTIGPVNSAVFECWVRGWNAEVWPREWSEKTLRVLLSAVEERANGITPVELEEELNNAGCWCCACDSDPEMRLATPTPDHVMSRFANEWHHWTAVGYAVAFRDAAWLEVLLEHQAPFCFASWAYMPISSSSGHDGGDLIPALPYAVHTNDNDCVRLCVAFGGDPFADTPFYCGRGGNVLSMAAHESILKLLTAPPRRAAAAAALALICIRKYRVGNDGIVRLDKNVVQMIARMVFESGNDVAWRAAVKVERLPLPRVAESEQPGLLENAGKFVRDSLTALAPGLFE